MLRKLTALWEMLIGDPMSLSLENRAFNSISVITLGLLTVLLPFNIMLGLMEVSFAVAILIVLQIFFFFLSRRKNIYNVSMLAYVIASYLTLAITYYYNSGSYGPTLLLFFLTFNLLIAFSPKKQHWLWAVLHLVLPLCLVIKEYLYPGWIQDTYASAKDRYIDILSSYLVTLTCIYLITNYLRKNYDREKTRAEERADKIDQQNINLELLNQKKDKLFSIIAHDLQSPLNSIITTLQLIAEHGLEPDDRKLLENELLSLTRNTSNMLTNLLSWSKMQMDGRGVKLSTVQVYEVTEQVLSLQKMLADKKGLRIINKLDPAVHVRADHNMLELIVRNLVNNAIKFTPSGGQVSITMKVNAGNCLLMVTDTGIGIDSHQQAELFSLKTQSTYGTNNEKGIGLGLVLCKELLTLQHGELWFESVPGKGTTFYVSLPVNQPASGRLSA